MDLEKLKALAIEAKALAEKATPGPWSNWPGDMVMAGEGDSEKEIAVWCDDGTEDDMRLIARARTAVPELADAVLALAAEVERHRASAPQPAVLFGGQAKLLRALAETTLRLAQLHGQKSGAHEALVEAETGLARALGFVPRESPPPETTAFDEDPACPDA